MSNQNNGGPAFPTETANKYIEGMTLRDYFAVHASEEDIKEASYQWLDIHRTKSICSRSTARYYHADVMLKEREK